MYITKGYTMSANLALMLSILVVCIAGGLYYRGFFDSPSTRHEKNVAAYNRNFWELVDRMEQTIPFTDDPYNQVGRSGFLNDVNIYVVGYRDFLTGDDAVYWLIDMEDGEGPMPFCVPIGEILSNATNLY